MQISKEKFDEMEGHLRIYREHDQESRHIERSLRAKINNFDEILDTIVRAANGLPLVQPRDDMGYAAVRQSYPGYGDVHQCTPPSVEEIHRYELAAAREVIVNLETQLAAVKAIAVFAKEHKA